MGRLWPEHVCSKVAETERHYRKVHIATKDVNVISKTDMNLNKSTSSQSLQRRNKISAENGNRSSHVHQQEMHTLLDAIQRLLLFCHWLA